MKDWRKGILTVLAAEMVVFASVGVWVFVTEGADRDRLPILIDGDAGFTGDNGVAGGSGTPDDPYVIEGWNIDGSAGHGIHIKNTASHFTVRNVTVHDGQLPGFVAFSGGESIWSGGCGVLICNASNGIVEDCTLVNNKWGILIEDSSDIALRRNTISEGGMPNVEYGIRISNSLRMTIDSNVMETNGVTFEGDLREHFDSHSISPSNTVNGLPLLFAKDETNWEVEGLEVGQLIAVNCSDVSVHGVTVDDSDIGITLAFCRGFNISESVVSGSHEYNILILNSSAGTVSDCEVSESVKDSGIDVSGSSDIEIRRCSFMDNRWYNLQLSGCTNTSVSECVFQGNGIAVGARDCSEVHLVSNNISTSLTGLVIVTCNDSEAVGNSVYGASCGLWISYESANFTAIQNTFFDCSIGVELEENVSCVTIAGNNFIDNEEDAEVGNGADVDWYVPYPEGGNFWSGHNLSDLMLGEDQDLEGADGIADTQYSPSENQTDAYPLAAPSGFFLDRPIPRVDILFGRIQPNTYFTASANATWDFSGERDLMQFRWDWGDDGTWDVPWSSETETSHLLVPGDDDTLRIQAIDSGGNVGELFTLLPFDSEPPRITIKVNPSPKTSLGDAYEGMSFRLYWGVLDWGGLSSVDPVIMVDGRDIHESPFSFSGVWTGDAHHIGGIYDFFEIPAGTHDIKVIASDGTGNTAEEEVSFTILSAMLQTPGGVAVVILTAAAVVGVVAAVAVFLVVRRGSGKADDAPAQGDETPPPG
jgi:parallel beta-helix repeat protein